LVGINSSAINSVAKAYGFSLLVTVFIAKFIKVTAPSN